MASDQRVLLGALASQLAHVRLLGAEHPPDPHKTAAGAAEPAGPDGHAAPLSAELPSPPQSPAAAVSAVGPAAPAPSTFPYFPLLPAELRLKIWHMSFLPRTVELHTQRSHYANDDQRGGTPKWQTLSRNPPALSVNAEARVAALERYTIALPLFAPPSRTFERPGELLQDSDRVLYLDLEQDTVVMLGDLDYTRLTKLLVWFRSADKSPRGRNTGAARGKGLKRLAMSVAVWTHQVGAATLKAFARTVFADVEEFVLFMYTQPVPPPGWMGGPCVLEETAIDADHYRRFVIDRGRQFRVGSGWMTVGQRPMKVADISFEDGW